VVVVVVVVVVALSVAAGVAESWHSGSVGRALLLL